MTEPVRIDLKEKVHHFTRWFFSGGWQLFATLLALYLLWDIVGVLDSIVGELSAIKWKLNDFPKN